MAVIRRVTPANPISNFPATVRPGPSIFDVLADGMAGFANHFDGLAREQARRDGAEMGAAAAGSYIPSNPGVAPPGMPRQGSYTPSSAGPTIDNPISPYRGPGTPGANVLPISGALDRVDPEIISAAQTAYGYFLPPGSRLEVSSGFRGLDEANHNGNAIDFAAYDPDGNLLRWDHPVHIQAAEIGRAMGIVGGVGAGPTYMRGDYVHWDTNDPRVWSDDDGGASDSGPGAAQWGARLAQAAQIGVEGLLAQAGAIPPVTSGAGIAVASRSDSGGAGDIRRYADAIASVESRGSGDYQAVGPETRTGNRAYGRYQVMDFNVGPWTEEVLGVRMTPEQFLADEAAQDSVFEAKFGQALAQYGNPQDAASVWFSGQPLAGNSRNDGFIDVPEYVQRFNAALGEGGTPTMSAMNGEVMPPQTAIRNEQGQLEMRPLDIFTSEYDIIRQNAALGTYAAGVLNNASLALSDLRRQFPLDPDGFRQAAQGYVSRMMENAPAPIREQLLSDLQLEAGRTLNGILAARQENTMARARAEIGARIETTALEYSTLLAQGDTEGAAVARANLESALRYRETLPGSTWGPEQTNMLLAGAERDAAAIRERTTTARNSEIGSRLSDVRETALDGRRHQDEAWVFSGEAASHPDYARTVAALSVRDMRPDFARLPPEQRAAAIAAEEARAISGDPDDEIFLGALRDTHAAALEAEQADVMSRMGQNGMAIGELTPELLQEDPTAFLRTLALRGQIADFTVENGYTNARRVFTNEERDALSQFMGPEADPTFRAQFAGMLLDTQGANAAATALELGAEQSAAEWIGLAHYTGNRAAMSRALTGGAMLRAGLARAATQDVVLSEGVMEMLEGLPAASAANFIQMARDYVAAASGTTEPTAADFTEALNLAMGGSGPSGGRNTTGGSATVFGGRTVLPPNVSGQQVTEALSRAVAAPPLNIVEIDGGFYPITPEMGPAIAQQGAEFSRGWLDANGFTRFDSREAAQAAYSSLWGEQGPPLVGGEPIDMMTLRGMRLEPVVVNGNVVMGQYYLTGDGWDATGPDGTTAYILNLTDLLSRMNVR